MGETKRSRKTVREELDRKLLLSPPSRDLLEQLAIACSENPKDQDATFQYAFALSRSQQASELRYAVSMLDGLVADGYQHQVDCLVGAATALYMLGDFDEARVGKKEDGIDLECVFARILHGLKSHSFSLFIIANRPAAKPFYALNHNLASLRNCTWRL